MLTYGGKATDMTRQSLRSGIPLIKHIESLIFSENIAKENT